MSQAGIASTKNITPPPGSVTDLEGQDSVVVPPDGSGVIHVVGAVVPAGSTPFSTTGNAGTNTETWNIQLTQATALSDATKVGLAAFDSSKFSVDTNGFVSLLSGDDLHVTPFIVSAAGGANGANYTTIQAACNAANAAGGGIVVVQPGTYNENLTLFSNVHIMGLQFADAGGGVTIVGTHTPPNSGGFCFQYVQLTGATAIFSSALAGSTHLVIANAAVQVTNGFTFNLPNWTGKLESFDVNATIGTADGYINNSGGSTIAIFNSSVGSGTTNVMNVSGSYFADGASLYCPVNFITGSSLNSDFNTYAQPVTLSNNATGYFRNSTFTGGSNAAITMSSSAAIEISHAVVSSSHNPAIAGAGAGTLTYTDINFLSNAAISGSLTLATVSWRPYSQAIAATDGTKVGTCAFNSAQFTVDANGFVSTTASTVFNWTDKAVSFNAVANNGYFITAASVVATMPASPTQGQTIAFAVDANTNTFVITANTGQKIRIGNSVNSATAGTATNNAQGDSVTLVYRSSDATWISTSVIGTWTLS